MSDGITDMMREIEGNYPPDGKIYEILHCPFCMGEPKALVSGSEFTKSRSAEIVCKSCNVKMEVAAIHNSTEWCIEKVVEKWNKRAYYRDNPLMEITRGCNPA